MQVGESYEQAAARELAEELSIRVLPRLLFTRIRCQLSCSAVQKPRGCTTPPAGATAICCAPTGCPRSCRCRTEVRALRGRPRAGGRRCGFGVPSPSRPGSGPPPGRVGRGPR
ncbi:NUDIX domain-containing protein [Streptomyces seoulensis]